jgi:tRNA A-37 threonylcarbamoyl transferase component Bud32
MPDLIGQSLGRYHILEQLGEGGMATVYKARDMNLERDVAFKIIRPDVFGPIVLERLLERFKREARTLAKLSHPNIVPILDFGEYEGAPYLIMPYIAGGTLKQYLKKNIPYRESVRLLIPIARALAHAHQEGIIHRDVKPSNILITRTGDPMLSDFGIAKILDTEETRELTSTGVGIGTPEYMAPEQGMGSVDERVDVYALGVIFYEMVTGRRPYQADTPMAVMLKKNTEPLPRPTQFVRDLPSAVENVLIKALARDPENRFPTMTAFTNALTRLVDPKGASATSQTGFTQTEKKPGGSPNGSGTGKGRIGWFPVAIGVGLLSICLVAAAILAWQFIIKPLAGTDTPVPITDAALSPDSTVETAPTVPLPTTIIEPLIITATVVSAPGGYDLAFVSDRDNGFGNLQVVIARTSNLADYQILDNPPGYERAQWPSFCGQRVAMEAFDTDNSKAQWIYLLGQEMSPEKLNGSTRVDALGVPRCSPDGQYMAYSAQNGNYWDLVIADMGNGEIIFQSDARSHGRISGYASWQETSRSFIFEAISPDNVFLRVNDFPFSPTVPALVDVGQTGVHPSISPDGMKVAFACKKDQLCVTDLSSGQVQSIYQTISYEIVDWRERVTPVWSGDGQWIYFAGMDGGDWDIFRIRPDGSGVENLTRDWPSNEVMPAINWQE